MLLHEILETSRVQNPFLDLVLGLLTWTWTRACQIQFKSDSYRWLGSENVLGPMTKTETHLLSIGKCMNFGPAPGEQKMCRLGINARNLEKLCLRVLQLSWSDLFNSPQLVISGLSGSLSLLCVTLSPPDVFPPQCSLLSSLEQVSIQCSAN